MTNTTNDAPLEFAVIALIIPLWVERIGLNFLDVDAFDLQSGMFLHTLMFRDDKTILLGAFKINGVIYNHEITLYDHGYFIVLTDSESCDLAYREYEHQNLALNELISLLHKWSSDQGEKYLKPYQGVTYYSLVESALSENTSAVTPDLSERYFPNGSEYDEFGTMAISSYDEPQVRCLLGEFCTEHWSVLDAAIRGLMETLPEEAVYYTLVDDNEVGTPIDEEEMVAALSPTQPI